MTKHAVIIVAGGSGKRMGTSIPKQFLLLNNLPVLMHTIQKFYNYNSLIDIILVLPAYQHEYWEELCKDHYFDIPHRVTIGGETRFQSVRNGIKLVGHQVQYVGVHDGVRPFVHEELIRRCFLSAEKSKAVIPVVLPKDSLRILRQNDSEVLPRDQVRIVQTPQVFDRNILADAYKTEYRETFTDDASVVEFAGHKIELIEGTYTNIKITDQQDLTFANHLFRHGITS